VTNRIFEDHSDWWDVLCNIETGKITVSKDVAPAQNTEEKSEDGTRSPASRNEPWNKEKSDASDNEFMAEVSEPPCRFGRGRSRCLIIPTVT
jgi:hypothetical protein